MRLDCALIFLNSSLLVNHTSRIHWFLSRVWSSSMFFMWIIVVSSFSIFKCHLDHEIGLDLCPSFILVTIHGCGYLSCVEYRNSAIAVPSRPNLSMANKFRIWWFWFHTVRIFEGYRIQSHVAPFGAQSDEIWMFFLWRLKPSNFRKYDFSIN